MADSLPASMTQRPSKAELKRIDPRKKKLTHRDMRDRVEESRRTRRPFERDWLLNMAYLAGEQYVRWNEVDGTVVVSKPDDDDQVRTVNNQMMKLVRIERAKMLRANPMPKVIPAKEDTKDEMNARVFNAVFLQAMDKMHYERRLRQGSFWVAATGNMFLKWTWDSFAKAPAMDVCPPFEIYPDPLARRFEDARWVIHQQYMDLETAWDLYGDMAGAHPEHLKTESTEPLSLLQHRIYADIGDGSTGENNLDGVTLSEYYEPPRPAQNFPGRYIVFTNSGIVFEEQGSYPYVHGMVPFTHVGHIERASSKWYSSICDFERIMQDELNRTENQIIENRNLANGTWFVPASMELDQPIRAVPRQVISVDGVPPGVYPELVTSNPLPSWVKDEPMRIAQTMGDIASQHEVSQGGVPGRVDSGNAIQLLQESDDAVMKDTILSLEEAISNGFTMLAHYYKAHGNKKLMANVYDTHSGAHHVEELLRDDINLDWTIKVETTTALPTSIAGKFDRVLNLVQYQVLQPQQALKLLDLTVGDPSLDPTLSHRKKAHSENLKMRKSVIHVDPQTGEVEVTDGVPPPRVYKQHDHITHIQVHTEYMNSEEWEQLPEGTKLAFQYHLTEHEQMVPPPPEAEGQGGGGEQPQPGPPQTPDGAGPAPVAI